MLVPSVIPGRRGFASGPHPVAGANHPAEWSGQGQARHWKLGSATIGGSAIIAMAALGGVGNLGSAGPEKALSSVAPQATEQTATTTTPPTAPVTSLASPTVTASTIGFRAGTLAPSQAAITFHNHRGSRGTRRHAHERYRSAGSLPCRHVTVRMASHVATVPRRPASRSRILEQPGSMNPTPPGCARGVTNPFADVGQHVDVRRRRPGCRAC